MSDSCKRSLFVFFSALVLIVFSTAAYAECDTECDPYSSYCSQECDRCTHWNQDGCDRWRASTCGDQLGGCLQDNCTPNWVETSRTNVGTYQGGHFDACTHHRVDSVTNTDYNQCNINSSYYSYTYCDDYIDGQKWGWFWPDCCSGYADDTGVPLSCNGYHSCS